MHIQNCEHPVRIYNKYINEWMYVRCGKCNTCRNSRAKRWVNRLEQERMCHPYTMFIYLDYDNANLPKFDLSYDPVSGQKFLCDSRYTFNDALFSEYSIPFEDLIFKEQADLDYFNGRLNHELKIPHGSVRDVQLFLKRFNKYCHDKVSKTYRNFRYFIVQEYGPTTQRPHYHGLMFIDDKRIADRFEEILSHSWRLGHSDFQSVEGTASSYVAQYLNCDVHLPSFYAHPKIRPFFLCSRQPPIGSLLQSTEEIREIFDSASPQRVCRTSPSSSTYSVVPILPSLKSRLFPKLQRFGYLSHPLRVALYGAIDAAEGKFYQDFEGWKNYFQEKAFSKKPLDNNGIYFSDYVPTDLGFQRSEVLSYLCVISDNFTEDRPLRELFRISNRVCFQAACFGVSLEKYVLQIEKFYDTVEKQKLNIQYNTQKRLISEGRAIADDFVHMYPIYRDYASFALSMDLNICDVPDYKKMVSLHKEIALHNTKTSKKNAYFEGKLSKSDPKLYNIIKSFYNAKKCHENAETLS